MARYALQHVSIDMDGMSVMASNCDVLPTPPPHTHTKKVASKGQILGEPKGMALSLTFPGECVVFLLREPEGQLYCFKQITCVFPRSRNAW